MNLSTQTCGSFQIIAPMELYPLHPKLWYVHGNEAGILENSQS